MKFSYDPTSNLWETLPAMQHSRSSFYLGRIKECIFAIGGKSNKVLRASVEKFCTVSRKWEFICSLKQQRYAHAGTSARNSIYISGGIVKKTSCNSLMRYESGGVQWHHLAAMKSCRSNHVMAAVKDRIYVFGGEIEKQGICQPVDCALECYTMQCDQWHTIAEKFNFPNEKECSCVTMEGFVYLIGGCRGNVTDHRNDVTRYDPDTDTWKSEAKLVRKCRGAGCVVLSLN
jgi:N-acetylneuraminic acid mutarotase